MSERLTGGEIAGSSAVDLITGAAGDKVRARAIDALLLTLSLCIAGFVAYAAAKANYGTIPDQNALFSADTGRAFANLSGNTEGYYRMKVHPLYGWFCVFYQWVVMGWVGLPAWIGIPAFSSAISLTCVGLLYAVLRRFEIGPVAAMSFTVLFSSSATFVFWSTLPETHMAGGASVLAAILLMTGRGAATERGQMIRSGVALMAGVSMVVTNGMIWALKQVDYRFLQQGAWKAFVQTNLAKAKPLVHPALWGIGLTYLLWSPLWPILGKRVGIPFNFLEERHYVDLAPGSSAGAVHVFGLTAPGFEMSTIISVLCLGLMAAAIRYLKSELWYLPLFTLFGVALHAVYAGDSGFLFSPDYMPLFIVSFALLAREKLPNWFPAIVLVAAALLLPINLQEWNQHLHGLAQADLLKTYETVKLH